MKLFQAAEKENDTIYHDTVPSNIPAVEKKAVAKTTSLPADVSRLSPDKDPFYKLIPFAITEKLSIYQVFFIDINFDVYKKSSNNSSTEYLFRLQERKDSLVRNELKTIDE